jgi:hypothetical protein
VLVNDEPVPVDGDGRFMREVPAREGLSQVPVVAREAGGKTRAVNVACRPKAKPVDPARVKIDWQ